MPDALLLDTNVLLLLLVARANPQLLQTFKRVSQFVPSDIQVLLDLLGRFRQLQTTPHVLTEASNFIDQAPSFARASLVETFRDFTQTVPEVYEPSASLTAQLEFEDLGLSDAALIVASRSAAVLTLDGELFARILSLGRTAFYFNNLRVVANA